MENMVQAWLSVWLYVITAIGVVLTILIIRNRKRWKTTDVLCACALVILVLHVLEEWVVPGGLHYSYNISHSSDALSAYPMSRLTDMITNFGGIVLGCIVLACGGFRKPGAIAVMIFCFAEVGIHVAIGVQDLALFWPYGMRVLYSPGLVTSVFGFLPVGILLARALFASKPRPNVRQWTFAILLTVVFAFLLINLPEALLGDAGTPYAFTDRGYYDRFADAFEADAALSY